MTAFDIRVTLISEDTGKPLATATRDQVASAALPRVGETLEHDGLMPGEVLSFADGGPVLTEPLVVTAVSHAVKRGLGGALRLPTVHACTRVDEGATAYLVGRLERDGWSCVRDAQTLTRLDMWVHPDKAVMVRG